MILKILNSTISPSNSIVNILVYTSILVLDVLSKSLPKRMGDELDELSSLILNM
jgi:hypothetical protein